MAKFSKLICISASQVGEMRRNHEVMSRISFDCRVELGEITSREHASHTRAAGGSLCERSMIVNIQ